MPQLRDVQPISTAGPNAHNQIGPRAASACVKLCGLDKSLGAKIAGPTEDWQYPAFSVLV